MVLADQEFAEQGRRRRQLVVGAAEEALAFVLGLRGPVGRRYFRAGAVAALPAGVVDYAAAKQSAQVRAGVAQVVMQAGADVLARHHGGRRAVAGGYEVA